MALGNSQKVIEDVGSEELRLTRSELNKLLDFVDALNDTLPQLSSFVDDIVQAAVGAANGDDFRTAVAALDITPVQTAIDALDASTLRKIVTTLERPAAPRFPTA